MISEKFYIAEKKMSAQINKLVHMILYGHINTLKVQV